MPRKANPYTRVTTVGSFVNAGWKEYWYKSIENGNEKKNTVGLLEVVAQECVSFSSKAHPIAEWLSFLRPRTTLAQADRISRESTEFGKAVHLLAESYLMGVPEPTEIDLSTKTKAYIRPITAREKFSGGLLVSWCKEAQVKPLVLGDKIAVECSLVSEKYKLTGHPDLVCTFGDNPTPYIIDWKTSKEFKDEHILQLSAYAAIVDEMYGIKVDDGAIIRVPSDPNMIPQFQKHEVHGLGRYFEAFLSCLDTYHFFNNKGRWKGE